MKSKEVKSLNVVHDDELISLLEKLGVKETVMKGGKKCKFCSGVVTIENIYSIFPESGDIKIVCENPDCIKKLISYVNEKKP